MWRALQCKFANEKAINSECNLRLPLPLTIKCSIAFHIDMMTPIALRLEVECNLTMDSRKAVEKIHRLQ